MAALLKISTVWLDRIETNVGINIDSIVIKSMLVSLCLCCVWYIPPVSSNSRHDITSSLHTLPLLLPCSALFYSPPPRDSAALKQTHTLWLAVSESPMTEGKEEHCVQLFHGCKWKHCKVQRVEEGHSPLWQYHLFIQMHEKPFVFYK